MIRRILFELYEFFETIFSCVPGTLGNFIRGVFYTRCFKKAGNGFRAGLRVKIQVPENISIGNNVGFNYGVWVAANRKEAGAIEIGNNVLIGPYTILHSGNHKFSNPLLPIYKQGYEFSKIKIEDDVWIAARCTILAGVTIGKGAVVAAGSVVIRNVEPFTVVGGVPAKVIAQRNG
jgi:galactoside O-acetyltransferase